MKLAQNVDDADVVVLWQDVLGIEKGVAELAKMKGKKVVVLQHGRNATVDYENYPLIAGKICVWGIKDVERLKSYGIDDKRIELTGTDVLFHTKPRDKHEGINVVMRPIHWDTAYIEENIILRDALRKINGINVKTKITEAHNPSDFDNPVYSYRDNFDHLDICADVLSGADVVVGAGEDGTFEMMAYAMDIPVVIADIWKPKSFLGRPPQEAVYTNACDVCKLDDLEATIRENLDNPDKLKKQRWQLAYEEGGVGLEGTPSDKIIKVINNL
jgi:hypothetical protein